MAKHPEASLGRSMESSSELELLLRILPQHQVGEGMGILGKQPHLEKLGLATSPSVVIQIDEKIDDNSQ